MKDFKKRVLKVIDKSDIILEVLDARFPHWTRIPTLERIIKSKGKKLILVLNKCDMISKELAEKWKKELEKEYPCVFISAKYRMGTRFLRKKIKELAPKLPVIVGVVGLPNVGKSSLINILKGKTVCPVSSWAGFTKGEQIVKISKNIYLYDSPGVYIEKFPEKQLLIIGSKNPEQSDLVEEAAQEVLEYLRDNFSEIFDKYFSSTDLEFIARKYNFYLKEGKPDIRRAAIFVLKKFHNWEFK
jgi:ribosome biogenesis GTPase A